LIPPDGGCFFYRTIIAPIAAGEVGGTALREFAPVAGLKPGRREVVFDSA